MTEISKRQQELESWEHFTLRRMVTEYCQRTAVSIRSLTYTPLKEREPDSLTEEECGTLFGVERSNRFEATPYLVRSIDPNHPYRFPDEDRVVLSSAFYIEGKRKLDADWEQTEENCRRNDDQSQWNDAFDKYLEDMAKLELEAQRNISIPILNDLEREVWESLQCECARLLTNENRQRGRNALAVAMRPREADEHATSELPSSLAPAKKSPSTAEASCQVPKAKGQWTSGEHDPPRPFDAKTIKECIDAGEFPEAEGLDSQLRALLNYLLGEPFWTAPISEVQEFLGIAQKDTKDGHRLRNFQKMGNRILGKESGYMLSFKEDKIRLKPR